MTIRTAIEQLLLGRFGSGDDALDPAQALSEQGFGDVSGELFGTALEHFSDTAPLAQADALAPVVTRISSVPYEAAELAPLGDDGIDGEDLDAVDSFGLFGLAASAISVDGDDTDIDVQDDFGEVAGGEEFDVDSLDSLDSFGSGAVDNDVASGNIEQSVIDSDLDDSGESNTSVEAESLVVMDPVFDDHDEFTYEAIENVEGASHNVAEDVDEFDDIDFGSE